MDSASGCKKCLLHPSWLRSRCAVMLADFGRDKYEYEIDPVPIRYD